MSTKRLRHFGAGYSYFGENYDDDPVGAKGMDVRIWGDVDNEYIFWDASEGILRTNGVSKFFNRPTSDAFCVQIKSEFNDTDAGHNCLEVTADCKAALATGGGNTAVQGVSRLAATYTATAGTLIGTYGQVCNLGVLNGSGIMLAGLYGLIEDGGTYTAVSHVASCWLDSHLDQAVTAGNAELLYMTNNGDTTLNQAIYVYAGNKITSLLNINTASGMLSANNAGAVSAQTGYRTIKITLEGETYYLVASKAVT